jgi:hypothetical protein
MLIRVDRLTEESLPMVIFACKSDPQGQIDVEPAFGNSIGEPFNVGLIEVTTATSEGKSKMRNGLRWLLYKLEQRQRESPPCPPAFVPLQGNILSSFEWALCENHIADPRG